MTSPDRRSDSVHRWLYRRLLRIHPGWIRQSYGAQMEADFADLLAACGPWSGRIRTWGIVLGDLLRSARPSVREPMTTIRQDIHAALRSYRHAPGFAALVVLILTVGIGGVVAMFSVVNGVLLADLPYRDAERLVMIWNRHETTGATMVQISGPDLVDYRSGMSSFSDLAFVHNATDNSLSDGGPAEQVDVGFVSANLFSFLGVDAAAGRTFSPDEPAALETSAGPVGPVVISHGLWSRRYGADATVIGRIVQLSGAPVQIIGVLPADFRFLLPHATGGAMSSGANDRIDVWRILPDRSFPDLPRSLALVRVLGRLAPGVSVAQAQEEADGLARRLRAGHRVHDERGTGIDVVPLRTDIVGHVRPILLSLFAAVGVVLLIACANVATLVSVRSGAREREVALRMALGAGRLRVLRQLLTEYALLACFGGAAGFGVAWLLVQAILAIIPPGVPLLEQVGVDARAGVVAMTLAAVATMLFGVWPAWRVVVAAPARRLSSSNRQTGPRGQRFRAVMVTLEIAASVMLVVVSGLLLRSFVQLKQAPLGFDPSQVVTARLALGHGPYADESRRRQFWQTLQREVESHPAVASAGLAWPLPFTGLGAEVPYDSVDGVAGGGRFVAFLASAWPGYFRTIGATVLDGRTFDERDLDRAAAVAVVDRRTAEQLYPATSAVGRRVWFDDYATRQRRSVEIIGVVDQIRHARLSGSEREMIYLLNPQARNLGLVVRLRQPQAAAILPDLRTLTAAIDPNVPLFEGRSLQSYVDDVVAPTRFTMTLAGAFGLVALLMAAVGLYGVVAYAVSQRSAELGLRMALGASAPAILRLVMGQGLGMAAVGVGAGLLGAMGAAAAVRGLLTDVSPGDPATFTATTVVLAAVVLAASYFPARRAAQLDPSQTLRGD